jgi:hypothetical protein
VFFGPEAQAILAPFLDRDPDTYCFSPREAQAEVARIVLGHSTVDTTRMYAVDNLSKAAQAMGRIG